MGRVEVAFAIITFNTYLLITVLVGLVFCADRVARSHRRRHKVDHRLYRRHVDSGNHHRMELSSVRMRKRRLRNTGLHGRGRRPAGYTWRIRTPESDWFTLRQSFQCHAFSCSR